MTTRLDGDLIRLEGPCRVEEAETLAGLLAPGGRAVDVSACTALHAAVAQVLLAFRPPLAGEPADAFLRERLIPGLGLSADGATFRVEGFKEEPAPSEGGFGGMKEPEV